MQISIHIPVSEKDSLVAQIAKLNKKADKFGIENISIVFGEEKYQTVKSSDGRVYLRTVAVSATFPEKISIAGWEFLGKIDHKKGMVFSVPGKNIPEQYWDAEPNCDHCHSKRDRNNTYILIKDGKFAQIGSSCLKDFLGYDPLMAMFHFDFYSFALNLLKDKEYSSERDYDNEGNGGLYVIKLVDFLAACNYLIRTDGFVKNTEDVNCTVNVAFGSLTNPRMKPVPYKDSDIETVNSAIAYILGKDKSGNSFIHNLQSIANRGYVDYYDVKIAVWVVLVYLKDMDIIQAKKSEGKRESNFLGTVGEKISVNGTVKKITTVETNFGPKQLVIIEDDAGNIIKTFTEWKWNQDALEYFFPMGSKISFTAKVKSHDVYNGINQTSVTHLKTK